MDRPQLAPLDLVQHRLAGHAEHLGRLVEGDPTLGDLGDDPSAQLVGDSDVPGTAGGESLAEAARLLGAEGREVIVDLQDYADLIEGTA